MIFPESDPTSRKMQKKCGIIFKCLRDACLKSKEKLYLANSRDIIQLI